MKIRSAAWAAVCVAFSVIAAVAPVNAQSSCTTSQVAAVKCFVGNAVTTNLLTPHFGMTTAQFEQYGAAVSQILQDSNTYAVILGTASAVADAMPPTNANGSSNENAQQIAMNQVVAAALNDGIVAIAPGTNQQDLHWFALDVLAAMNQNSGVLLSPGGLLRVLDSYVITATSGGAVDWTTVSNNLGTLLNNLVAAKMLKLPASITLGQTQTFALAIAKQIYVYKVATGRTSL